MPTYEYHCDACGSDFEELQSIIEPPLEQCPSCGGKPRRLISAGAGLIFKGHGFYITDHRSQKYQADAAKDKSSPSSTASDTVKKSSGSKSSD